MMALSIVTKFMIKITLLNYITRAVLRPVWPLISSVEVYGDSLPYCCNLRVIAITSLVVSHSEGGATSFHAGMRQIGRKRQWHRYANG